MSRARVGLVGLLLLAPLLVGGKCGGDGGSGSPPRVVVESPDPRCAALADTGGFPPGFDFVPDAAGGPAPTTLLAATATRSNLVPVAIEEIPFRVPEGAANYLLPADADGDGKVELFKSINDLFVLSPSLAVVTASGLLEGAVFVDPSVVGPRTVRVAVPPAFDETSFAREPGLPAPGDSRLQTGVTSTACLAPGEGALDSRGDPVGLAVDARFQCDGPGTYVASFTAAGAVVAGRLLLPVSNVGVDAGREDTQFLPGAVVVFDLDLVADPPIVSPTLATPAGRPYVFTSGFNPTRVTAYTTPAGRRLALVTLTGAIGIRADDPETDVLEGGAVSITTGAIDVLDAESLERIATIPLRSANPTFDPLAIDPTGRVALLGEVNARHLYAIDLGALWALGPAGDPPVTLEQAVIFDGLNPLVVPSLAGGAPAVSCPGQIAGVAFSDAGDRAFALEACDGSLTAIALDLTGNPSTLELRDRIVVSATASLTAPIRVDTVDQLRRPSALKVRPGRPGIDYVGPDVFFLVSDPEAFLCGVRIDSP